MPPHLSSPLTLREGNTGIPLQVSPLQGSLFLPVTPTLLPIFCFVIDVAGPSGSNGAGSPYCHGTTSRLTPPLHFCAWGLMVPRMVCAAWRFYKRLGVWFLCCCPFP